MGINVSVRALTVLGILCVTVTPAHGGEMYVAPAVVHTDDDGDRLVDDSIGGGQISVGWVLSDRVSIEGMGGYSWLSGVDDLKIWDASVNLLYSFNPYSNLSPYLLGGFGMMRTDGKTVDKEDSALATAGLGLMYRFGNSPVSLRLEYRARFEILNTLTFEDRITALGLQFSFGRKNAPAPPAPVDPDSDEDGVPDSRDACPDTPLRWAVDSRGCPRDVDGDGVTDIKDRCPNTATGVTVDARGCEIEYDGDNDSVIDRQDACPNTTAGARVDVKGCEIREVINLPGVNFETNSDRFLPGAESVLNDAAATLRMNQDIVVEVAGHTDSDGSAEHNKGLSERRAETVRDYLISRGAHPSNLTSNGYGEAAPIADNATAEGRARNRRVELRILNTDPQ